MTIRRIPDGSPSVGVGVTTTDGLSEKLTAQAVVQLDGSGNVLSGGLSAADQVLVGAVTETAPATDTASSGLNGRLQRIAQRITSLIALLPAALGAGGGLKVDGSGTALPTSLATLPALTAGTAEIGKVYTGTFNVAATALTRPANTTAYTANDSISDNATAGSVTANSVSLSDTNDAPIHLAEILLITTDTGAGGVQIRLHLFNSDPTASSGVVGGDNAAWSNKQAGWVGSFSGTLKAFSDGARGVLVSDEGTLRLINPVTGAKTLFWQLQTLGALTPSANSTTYTPRFKGFQARAA